MTKIHPYGGQTVVGPVRYGESSAGTLQGPLIGGIGGSVRSVDWGDGLTGQVRSRLVAAIVVLLLGNTVALAAHDGSSGGSSAALGDAASAPTTAATATAPTTAPTTIAPPTQQKQATTTTTAPRTTPTTTTRPGPPPTLGDGYVYEVTVTPTCARVGEEFTITFKLKPGGGAVLTAVYADGDTHETMHSAIAGESGLVVWKWKVLPVPGEGVVITEAYDPEQQRKGRTDVGFVIVEAGDEC